MSNTISIDGTNFAFPADWRILPFDDTQGFKTASGQGIKGCDLVAIHGRTLWLIEVKDYTYPEATIPPELAKMVCQKVNGTLGLLHSWARNKSSSEVLDFARDALGVSELRAALHIELPPRDPTLLAQPLATHKDRLLAAGKRSLRIDKWEVTSTLLPSPNTPWKSMRDPATRHRHIR